MSITKKIDMLFISLVGQKEGKYVGYILTMNDPHNGSLMDKRLHYFSSLKGITNDFCTIHDSFRGAISYSRCLGISSITGFYHYFGSWKIKSRRWKCVGKPSRPGIILPDSDTAYETGTWNIIAEDWRKDIGTELTWNESSYILDQWGLGKTQIVV